MNALSTKSPDAVSILIESVCPIWISSMYAAENFLAVDPRVELLVVVTVWGKRLDSTVVIPTR